MEKRRSRKGIRNNSFILQNSYKNKAVLGPNIKSCQNIDDINNIGNNKKDISKKNQGINNKIGNNSFNDISSQSEKQSDKNQDLGNVVLESEFFGNYQENSGFKSINIFEQSGDNFEELDQKNEFMDTFQSKFDEEQKNNNILSLQKFESPQNESGIIEQEKSSQLKGTKRMSKQNLKRKSSLLNFNQEKLVQDYCDYINEEILNQLNNIQMQFNLQDLSLEQEQQQKNILNQFPEMEKKRKIQESNDKIKNKLQFLQIFEEIEGLSVEKQQLKENVQNMSIFQTLQQINEDGKASIFAIVEQQYLKSASDKQLLNNKKVNHKNQMERLDFYINELKQIVNQDRKSVKSSTFISKSQTLQGGKQSQLTNIGTIQKDLSNKKNSNLDYYNMRDIEKEEIQKTEANIKKIINSSNNYKFVGFKSNDISPINQLIQDDQNKNNNKKKVNVFSDNVLEYQNSLKKEKDLNNFTFYNSKQKSLNNISAENKEENENNRDKNNNINKFKVNSFKSINRISNSCNTNNSNVQSTDSSGKNNNNQNKKQQLLEHNVNISNNSSNSKSILSIAEEGQQNYFNQRNGKLRSIPNLGSPINIRKINYQMGQKGNGQNLMRNSLNLKKSAKKILMSNRKNEIKKVNSSDNTDNFSDRENNNKKNKAENDNNLNTQKLEEKYQEDELFNEKAENVKINQNELYKQIETSDLEFKSYRTNYNFFQTKVSDSEHNSEDNDSENENESENESEKYEKKINEQQQQIEIENLQ
ncbi:hypothetical protein PPERSA_11726 [Pseudocohnilembus persalinus]|uniref:Uncharacterized protein n=1 Tax=Pseudocohnilembus persalinus TaxID=266149 RepID=A0A0V0QGG3_PSEPJ|nr:hypothetical protein PPERSA_11726 [Pseudocohnilembus persalinus]|eukprot:KRX01279.1 hypothetical protein PPERSA_11726 [Pseudocohnilembus persalinus]